MRSGRVTGYTGLDKIGQTLAPVMIRRRKSEVLRATSQPDGPEPAGPMTEMQMLYHEGKTPTRWAKVVRRWRQDRVFYRTRISGGL